MEYEQKNVAIYDEQTSGYILNAVGYGIGFHLVTRRISPVSPSIASKSK